MRDENGRFKKGYSGNPNGRPKRVDELMLLNIWEDCGRGKFVAAIENGESWAIKSLVDKLFPNKRIALDYKAFDPDVVNEKIDFSSLSNEELDELITAAST